MSTPSRIRSAPALALAVLLSGSLAACGGSDTASSSSGASPAEGVTVDAAQFSWTAAGLTNAILAEVVERKPNLGVKEIKTTQLDPAAAWAGAQRGDVDLLTEVALPNQKKFADQATERMEIVSETYGEASQGWFVPAYAVAPGGPLAGLKSVTQLNDYSAQLGGKFYDADPGYVTTEQNTKRLQGYGVDLEHVVAGEAAELAQLDRAYGRKEPIALYLYHPHAVHAQYEMVQLEEPTPYAEDCFTTGTGACAMPAYSANIAVSKELKEQAPKFVGLLEDLRISVDEMEQMQKAVDVDDEEVEAVATRWVEQNAATVEKWATG